MQSRTLIALLMVATSATAASPVSTTILVGQSWLGLWRGGKLVASHEQASWQFNASQIGADGRTIKVAAYLKDGSGDPSTVLIFDARTLTLLKRVSDPSFATAKIATPLNTDLRVPDATGSDATTLPETVISTPVSGGISFRVRGMRGGAAHRLPPGLWRVALSPDGSTAVAFAKPPQPSAPWRGQAWDTRSGKTIVAPNLSIDEGSDRENGARRELACLLPRGEGAIFTYIGAPADRYSEYQPFVPGNAKPVDLNVPYVMSCLAAR